MPDAKKPTKRTRNREADVTALTRRLLILAANRAGPRMHGMGREDRIFAALDDIILGVQIGQRIERRRALLAAKAATR